MLIPRIPHDDDPLWAALPEVLRRSADFHVVDDGVARADPDAPWTDARLASVVAALQARPLRYLGARHGQPLAPHFAIDVDGMNGRLVELITMRFRGDGDRPAECELLHDLAVVAACVSVAWPECTTLQTPLRPGSTAPLPEGFAIAADGTLVLDVRMF